ncbi:MAG: hypothetical protein ACRET2_09880 [Steroidobacteraceae bacterium]
MLDRARAQGEPAEYLDPAARRQTVDRIGDEIRRLWIDRGKVDVVAFGDRAIFSENTCTKAHEL